MLSEHAQTFGNVGKPSVYLGIDPGSNGGMVLLYPRDDPQLPRLYSLSRNEPADWYSWIRERADQKRLYHVHVSLEQVGGYIGEGRGDRGSHMFQFGRTTGMLEGMLIAAGLTYSTVPSRVWLKEYGLKKDAGESDNSWKNRIKVQAELLFDCPGITLSTADALLIAEWRRRKEERS